MQECWLLDVQNLVVDLCVEMGLRPYLGLLDAALLSDKIFSLFAFFQLRLYCKVAGGSRYASGCVLMWSLGRCLCVVTTTDFRDYRAQEQESTAAKMKENQHPD